MNYVLNLDEKLSITKSQPMETHLAAYVNDMMHFCKQRKKERAVSERYSCSVSPRVSPRPERLRADMQLQGGILMFKLLEGPGNLGMQDLPSCIRYADRV